MAYTVAHFSTVCAQVEARCSSARNFSLFVTSCGRVAFAVQPDSAAPVRILCCATRNAGEDVAHADRSSGNIDVRKEEIRCKGFVSSCSASSKSQDL